MMMMMMMIQLSIDHQLKVTIFTFF